MRLTNQQVRELMQVALKWAGPDENDSRSDDLEMALRAVRFTGADDGWITSADGLSRRKAAPDAAAPMIPSLHATISFNWGPARAGDAA